MLRLFGIPYITAPMEAEAQCAALLTLGLVDGIITDDSDVFLFGGARVLKNMFNQSKTVECFLLADLDRELGLRLRERLRAVLVSEHNSVSFRTISMCSVWKTTVRKETACRVVHVDDDVFASRYRVDCA